MWYYSSNIIYEWKTKENIELEVQVIIQEYKDIFEEPHSMPPSRFHDHRIPLKDGSEPVSCKPYRWPCVQKTEIENIVREMLTTRIIAKVHLLAM